METEDGEDLVACIKCSDLLHELEVTKNHLEEQIAENETLKAKLARRKRVCSPQRAQPKRIFIGDNAEQSIIRAQLEELQAQLGRVFKIYHETDFITVKFFIVRPYKALKIFVNAF
jgi:hypothetical protein